MKKRRLFILLIALTVLASCIREFNDAYLLSNDVGFSIDEAKKAFERDAEALEVKPLTTNRSTRTQKKTPVITPLWNKGETFTADNEVYAVIPLNIPLTKVFARKQKDVQYPDDEKYNNTDIRLLIQKKQNNEYLYTIAHITGDFSYIVKKHRSIKAQKLDNLGSFSGKIRYFDLKGQMLWGEIYKDGMKVGKISLVENPTEYKAEKAQTRLHVETYCEYDFVEYETCYHYGYDMGEGYVENGVDCVVDYEWEEVCYEEYVEDGEENCCPYCGSPSCSGECQDPDDSSTPNEDNKTNKVHENKKTDVIADKELLDMKRKAQKGNTCVPTIMEYILKNRGNDINRKDIIKYYEEKLSKNGEKYKVSRDGVPSNVVPSGVVNFLGTDAIENSQYGGVPPFDYKAAIDRGNLIMTNIFLGDDGNKVGHNILVIGYTEDGNYIYIDPNYSDKEFECSPDYLEEKNVSKYDFEIKKK